MVLKQAFCRNRSRTRPVQQPHSRPLQEQGSFTEASRGFLEVVEEIGGMPVVGTTGATDGKIGAGRSMTGRVDFLMSFSITIASGIAKIQMNMFLNQRRQKFTHQKETYNKQSTIIIRRIFL